MKRGIQIRRTVFFNPSFPLQTKNIEHWKGLDFFFYPSLIVISSTSLPPFVVSCLGFCCTKQKTIVRVHLCGCLDYGDLAKVFNGGINCRIPRTSKRRGADSEERAREHCCFGSLTGFLATVVSPLLFFFLGNRHIKEEKHSQKGLRTFLFGCMDLQKGSSCLSSLALMPVLTGQT